MTTTFSRLMKQDFADLEHAAGTWQKLAENFETAHRDHTKKVSGPLHGKWRGESADSGFPVLTKIESQLDTARVDATSFATVLRTIGSRMKQAQTDLENAVTRAEQDHFTVDETSGKVGLPKWLTDAHNDPDYQTEVKSCNEQLAAYQERIDQAVKDAESADTDGQRALANLYAGDLDEDGGLRDAAESSKAVNKILGIGSYGIPDGSDPRQAAAWWRALNPDEQQMYLATYPEKLGVMGGLPADARDQANRLLLDEYLDGLGGPGPGTGMTADQWNKEQEGLQGLKNKLDLSADAPKGKELYLLKIDPSGNGQAVVAMGNPDTATNTAVLVPGTNTNLKSMPGQIDRIAKLQKAAEDQGGGANTSVISWLGYDPPQEDVGSMDFDLGVAGTSIAEKGGKDLRQFVTDTRVAQGGYQSHITVIGHSYGSTTVGAGAYGSPKGLGANDIVVVGSPGMTVNDVSGLHMDPSHVYVGAAQDDPIITYFSDATLGKNPARESFGAQHFAVDTHGHSGYWDTDGGLDSESLRNQGRIIAGYAPTTAAATPDPPTHNWP